MLNNIRTRATISNPDFDYNRRKLNQYHRKICTEALGNGSTEFVYPAKKDSLSVSRCPSSVDRLNLSTALQNRNIFQPNDIGNEESFKKQSPSRSHSLDQSQAEEIKIEEESDNDYEKKDYFIRLKVEEFHTAFLTFTTMIVSLMYHDANNFQYSGGLADKQPKIYKASINACLIIISFSVLFYIMSLINRYYFYLTLYKTSANASRMATFFSGHYFPYFFIEVLHALLHPNILCQGVKFKIPKSFYLVDIEYELNDIFVLLVLFRIYVIFRFFISLPKFYSFRSYRIAALLGTTLTREFAFRSIIAEYPFFFFISFCSLSIVIFSFMLKIVEGPIYTTDKGINDFRTVENCIWNVLITMTTVGYGDLYPLTNFGRIIAVLISIAGTCYMCLLTLVLQKVLSLSPYESHAYSLREKLILKDIIERRAGQYFNEAFKHYTARKKYRKVSKDKKKRGTSTQKRYEKRMTDSLYRKIDAKRNFKEIIQFYRNKYETLTEADMLKTKVDEFQDGLNEINDNSDKLDNLLDDIIAGIQHLG